MGLGAGTVLGILITLLAQAVIFGGAEGQRMRAQAELSDAIDACDIRDESGVDVSASGDSVTISGAGTFSGPSYESVGCVGRQLDMPDFVLSEISQTRALDGRQEESWEDYSLSWSYHPENGLNAVFSVSQRESR